MTCTSSVCCPPDFFEYQSNPTPAEGSEVEGLSAEVAFDGNPVTLEWEEFEADFGSLIVLRDESPIAALELTETSYEDSSIGSGESYDYSVVYSISPPP